MKKVIIPILVLAAAGAGWYFLMGNKNGGPTSLGSALKQEAFKGSMGAAVKLGIPMKCSYSIGEELESEGYIKGKNYRGKATVENGKVSEVIMKDNCMWNWDETTKEGTKFCFEGDQADAMWADFDEDEVDEMEIPEGYSAPDMEFDCKPAVVSDSMFTAPTDVKFVDMDEVFKNFAPSEGMGGEGVPSMNIDDWK